MSRSITQTSSSSSAVAAGSSVIVPVNTTTGFNAGDYVYTLPTGGVGTRATGTIGVGADSNYVATTFPTTYLSTGDFRTFSYGPYIDQQLYTGTTKSYGAITVATTTVSTTTQQHYRNCTLLTGNVVQMYNNDVNLYFRIISNTGAIIKAETLIASNYYRFSEAGNFACCCLTSGNIQFVWNDNTVNSMKVQQYTSAGTAISSANDVTAPASYRNLSMCALSAGGSVVTGISGSSSSANINFIELFPDGSFLWNETISSGLSGGSTWLFPVVGLPASAGANLWACWVQNTVLNDSVPNGVLNIFSDFTLQNRGATTGTGGNPYSHNFNVTVATDGTICCARSIYGGSTGIAKFTYNISTNVVTFVSSTIVAGASSLYLIPTSSGAINAIYQSGSTIFMKQISSTNSVSSAATLVTVNNDPYYGRFVATGFGSGLVTPMFSASSTTYAAYCIANTFAVTNGVTQLTGASYTPTEGYYLMGVAATNAAANATGQVIMNGTAQLGSTYPTVTTPIYYSYQTTASQPLFGQRGSVSATTVTLRGLEA
jgi:hypothetical protein